MINIDSFIAQYNQIKHSEKPIWNIPGKGLSKDKPEPKDIPCGKVACCYDDGMMIIDSVIWED